MPFTSPRTSSLTSLQCQRLFLRRVLVLAAGLAAALAPVPVAAVYPLRSRCVDVPSAAPCVVAAIGAEDRFMQSSGDLMIPFAVHCGNGSDTHLVVRDLHNGSGQKDMGPRGAGFRVDFPYSLTVNGPEPGTHIFNVSVVQSHTGAHVDWMPLCLDITPSPAHVRVTALAPPPAAGAPPTFWPATLGRYHVSGKPPASGYADDGGAAAAGPPVRPVKVLWLGDTHSFDGMKQFILSTILNAPTDLVTAHYMDLACSPPGGLMERLLLGAGVPVFRECINCPEELCSEMDDFYAFAATLPSYNNSVELLPAAWREFFTPLMRHFAQYDVVVQVNDRPVDYYVPYIARMMHPRLAHVADLTSRFRLHHPPHGPPPPFDAQFAPSYHVATHPAVLASGLPAYVNTGSVDTSAFDPDVVQPLPMCDKRQWPTSAGPTDGPVLGFIARVSPEKGLGLLLAAAAQVVAANPSVRLLVVGHAKKRPEYFNTVLDTLARAHGLHPYMLVHTFVDPADIPRVFACLDVFVAPYVRAATETFALVNIEAMAMRVPFVHFGTGGIQDYARHMENSVQAADRTPDALADAILTLVNDAALRHRLGVNGRALVSQHYTKAQAAHRAAVALRRVVAGKLLDGHMQLGVTARALALGAARDRCDAQVVRHSVHTRDNASALFMCVAWQPVADVVVGPLSNVPAAREARMLDVLVTMTPTAVPSGLPDLTGLVGFELRRAAVELFLERHGRRSRLCVELAGAVPLHTVCTTSLFDAVVAVPQWDAPPVTLADPVYGEDAASDQQGVGEAPRGATAASLPQLRIGVSLPEVPMDASVVTMAVWVQDSFTGLTVAQ